MTKTECYWDYYGGSGTILSTPENAGLTIKVKLDAPIDWEFEMFTIWEDENGRVYWAEDSGCSCPEPYENVNSLADLNSGTPNDAVAAARQWINSAGRYSSPNESLAEWRIVELEKVLKYKNIKEDEKPVAHVFEDGYVTDEFLSVMIRGLREKNRELEAEIERLKDDLGHKYMNLGK